MRNLTKLISITALTLLGVNLVAIVIVAASLVMSGCGGSGGGESVPDTQTQTAVEQCGDSDVNITITATSEEVNDIVDEAIAAGDDVEVEEIPTVDQGSVLKLYKITIVSGCHNAVVDQDDHTVNDNDTNINLQNSPAGL